MELLKRFFSLSDILRTAGIDEWILCHSSNPGKAGLDALNSKMGLFEAFSGGTQVSRIMAHSRMRTRSGHRFDERVETETFDRFTHTFEGFAFSR